MMYGCKKCRKMTAILFLLLGLSLLAADLGYWTFWGISWAAGLFTILGVTGLAMGTCKDCQAMMNKK